MNKRAKELYLQLEHTSSIDEKVYIYRNLTFEFLNNDIDRCADVIEELMTLATETDHALGIVEAHNALGRLSFKKNKLDEALIHFEKALSLADTIAHSETVAHILLAIGMVNFNLGKLDQAERYFKDALSVAAPHHKGFEPFKATCLDHLGNVMLFKGRLDDAENYYKKAVEGLKNHPENRGSLASAKGGHAYVLVKKKQYKQAIDVLLSCLDDFKEISHKLGEAQTLINIAHCYNQLTDRGEAIKYLQLAQKLSKTLNNKATDTQLYNGFGEIYLGLSGYEEALQYLEKAETNNLELKRADLTCNTWDIKVEVLSRSGDLIGANTLLEKLQSFAAENGIKGFEDKDLS